jgi:hypothetical protein
MNEEDPESESQWRFTDIAAMLNSSNQPQQLNPYPKDFNVSAQNDEGTYFIDPDYAEMLEVEDISDLLRRKE